MTARARAALLGALGLGLAGCLLSEEVCTPADSTYSCCIKQNPGKTEACGASGTAIAVGTLTAAATLSSDGELFTGKLRAAVEKVLRECAHEAHEAVNRRRLGGEPTWKQCKEILSKGPDGKEITLAMQLGEEKHAEALKCAASRLGQLLPGRFSIEQRYRHDSTTGKLELVTPEQRQKAMNSNNWHELKGTLVPDVAIHHRGSPLRTLFIYDFKFPCLEGTRPKWTIYPKDSPYPDQTQGTVYKKFLGPALRITPWETI